MPTANESRTPGHLAIWISQITQLATVVAHTGRKAGIGAKSEMVLGETRHFSDIPSRAALQAIYLSLSVTHS